MVRSSSSRTSAFAQLDSGLLEFEPIEDRAAAGGDQDLGGLESPLLPVELRDHGLSVSTLDPDDLGGGDHLDPFLRQNPRHPLGDLRLLERSDAVEHLDDRHPGSQVGEELPHLEPDVVPADDHHRLGQLLHLHRRGRGEVAGALEPLDGGSPGGGTGGDEEALRPDLPSVHVDRIMVCEAGVPLDDLEPIVLREVEVLLLAEHLHDIGLHPDEGAHVDAFLVRADSGEGVMAGLAVGLGCG